MSSRLEPMDAQRFDLSKISVNSAISLVTQATSGHGDVPQSQRPVSFVHLTPISDCSITSFVNADRVISVLQSSTSSLRLDAMDAQRYDIFKSRHRRGTSSFSTNVSQASTACSSPTSDLESDSASSDNDSLIISTPPTTESSPSVILEDGPTPGPGTDKIDDTNSDEYTTTCTIIRPPPRSPIIGFFSRPSSPISRPSSPINFGPLNCFGSTDAFEDEVDYIQAQRAQELAGNCDVRVLVTETRGVYREESWRDAVQALLYGDAVEENQGGAVISHGD